MFVGGEKTKTGISAAKYVGGSIMLCESFPARGTDAPYREEINLCGNIVAAFQDGLRVKACA